MRKQYLRFLIALIGVAGLGVAAKGQSADQLVVNIPYEFVVSGKTLPAGTYRVDRASNSNERELVLSSFDRRASTIVVAKLVESSDGDKVSVSFEQVGGQLFLSKIKTADHLFIVPASRSAILEAEAKSHSGASASGDSAGGN